MQQLAVPQHGAGGRGGGGGRVAGQHGAQHVAQAARGAAAHGHAARAQLDAHHAAPLHLRLAPAQHGGRGRQLHGARGALQIYRIL